MGKPLVWKVSLLAAFVVLAACHKGHNETQSTAEVVPTIDGLSDLKPDFSTAIPEPGPAADSAKNHIPEITALKRENDTQMARLKQIKSQLEIATRKKQALITAAKTAVDAEGSVENMHWDAEISVKDLMASGYLKRAEPALDARYSEGDRSLLKLNIEARELQNEIDQLSYRELWFTNKKAELKIDQRALAQKIETAEEAFAKVKKEIEGYAQAMSLRLQKNKKIVNQRRLDISEATVQEQLLMSSVTEATQQVVNSQNQLKALNEKVKPAPKQNAQRTALVEKLNKLKSVIISEYKSTQTIDIQKINEATLLNHLRASDEIAPDLEKAQAALLNLVSQTTGVGIAEFKVRYEDALAKSHSGKTLIYNRDAVTVEHPLAQNRMQCYSGTTLFLLLSELKDKPYPNTVVILTRGHVLPGYIGVNPSGKLNLYGIETTAAGKANADYGPTSTLSGEIRVFDARQFLFVELFKNDLKNLGDLYGQMLKTIAAYHFDVSKFKAQSAANGESSSPVLNSSPLGFGQADVAAGDIVREEIDHQIVTLFQPAPAGSGQIESAPILKTREEIPPCELLDSKEMSKSYPLCSAYGTTMEFAEYLERRNQEKGKVNSFDLNYLKGDQRVIGSYVHDGDGSGCEYVPPTDSVRGKLVISMTSKANSTGLRIEIPEPMITMTDKGKDKVEAEWTGYSNHIDPPILNGYGPAPVYAEGQNQCRMSVKGRADSPYQNPRFGLELPRIVISIDCPYIFNDGLRDFNATIRCRVGTSEEI